jgi:hypothetical protein
MAKTQVEECYRLSIYALRWHLYPGCKSTMTWRRGEERVGSADYEVFGDRLPTAIRLCYSKTPARGVKEEHEYVVALTTTPLPWGGVRYWFLCPLWGCERRVACLYLPPGRSVFACRQCYDLSYESRQKRDTLGKLFREVDASLRLRARQPVDSPPPVDRRASYVTSNELRDRSRLTDRELSQLLEAHLLLPDTTDGRYRPKLITWAIKLAYLLRRGWEIDEIKAWSVGRWKLGNPRRWPPRREHWRSN